MGTIYTSTQTDEIHFDYDDSVDEKFYIEDLPKKHNVSNELFTVFENLLPENEQLSYIKYVNNITNYIDILLHLNNVHGTFEFYTEEEFKTYIPKKSKIFIYNEAESEILSSYEFPNILDYSLDIPKEVLYPKELKEVNATGLSGFQYKFSVDIDFKNQRITKSDDNSSNYFIKPYSEANNRYVKSSDHKDVYIPYLLINEHIFMSLAKEFGFKVPYNAIVKGEEDYNYIIKRYDRYNSYKIDHREVLTIIGKVSQHKYNITLTEVFNAVSKYLNHDETVELFSFFVFSIIIGHGDLHAKNISLIYKSNSFTEKEMTLAPYYDISTAKIYKGLPDREIGMKLGNKNKNIKTKELLELANNNNIPENIASKIINDFSDKFEGYFLNHINKLPNDVKMLQVQTNRQGYTKPLDEILKTFYRQRVEYINKHLREKQKTENKKTPWK